MTAHLSPSSVTMSQHGPPPAPEPLKVRAATRRSHLEPARLSQSGSSDSIKAFFGATNDGSPSGPSGTIYERHSEDAESAGSVSRGEREQSADEQQNSAQASAARMPGSSGNGHVDSPIQPKPRMQPTIHSILSQHGMSNGANANRPRLRKSLTWDLPDDQTLRHQRDHSAESSQMRQIPTFNRESASTTSEGCDAESLRRSFSPSRFSSSPAPIEADNDPRTEEEQPRYRPGPFYNDPVSGRNFSRAPSAMSGSRAPSVCDSVASEWYAYPPPRCPSIPTSACSHEGGRSWERGRSRFGPVMFDHSRRSSMNRSALNSCSCSHCAAQNAQQRGGGGFAADFSLFDRPPSSFKTPSSDFSPRSHPSLRPAHPTHGGSHHPAAMWDLLSLEDELHDLRQERSFLQHQVEDLHHQRQDMRSKIEMLMAEHEMVLRKLAISRQEAESEKTSHEGGGQAAGTGDTQDSGYGTDGPAAMPAPDNRSVESYVDEKIRQLEARLTQSLELRGQETNASSDTRSVTQQT